MKHIHYNDFKIKGYFDAFISVTFISTWKCFQIKSASFESLLTCSFSFYENEFFVE